MEPTKNAVLINSIDYCEVLKWPTEQLKHVIIRSIHEYGVNGRIGTFKLRVSRLYVQGDIIMLDKQGIRHNITIDQLRDLVWNSKS